VAKGWNRVAFDCVKLLGQWCSHGSSDTYSPKTFNPMAKIEQFSELNQNMLENNFRKIKITHYKLKIKILS